MFGVRNVDLGTLLITIGVTVLVFLIIREVVCWYWKINAEVDLLEDIREEVRATNAILKKMIVSQNASEDPSPVPEPTQPKK